MRLFKVALVALGVCIAFLVLPGLLKDKDTSLITIILLADGVVWGFVTRAIVKGKGYENYNSWFWCGFLLAIIGVIVVACKPAVNATQSYALVQPQASEADELKKYKELLDSGAITQAEYESKKKQILKL